MSTRSMRRVTARHNWDRLSVSFWFAPAIMALGAVLLAWALYWLDVQIPNVTLENSRFFLSGTVSEMRSSLLVIATTTLATAGVVFTLLTLPLGTVVAQYGSRLLRVFLGDRTTQLVLGMFVFTFVYCIAAALSIQPVREQPQGPQITATVGLYLMLATFASLILLVQHISTMLQAPNIAAAAGAKLVDVILSDIPDEIRSDIGQGQSDRAALAVTEGYLVRILDTGYIQSIDPDYILTLVREKDLTIQIMQRPGDYVWRDAGVAVVWPAAQVDERLDKTIRRAFRIGNQRTPTQDVECAVNQLVEMAVRAMSPAINDPFTAMTCLDHLGTGLALFARQGERSRVYYDMEGRIRLILEPATFEMLLNSSFNMLRHASCDNAGVLLHMLDVIGLIGQSALPLAMRHDLLRHAELVVMEGQAGKLIEQDRQLIGARAEALRTVLSHGP